MSCATVASHLGARLGHYCTVLVVMLRHLGCYLWGGALSANSSEAICRYLGSVSYTHLTLPTILLV
eukprot:5030809-Pyramimonas_sp.AAC.1